MKSFTEMGQKRTFFHIVVSDDFFLLRKWLWEIFGFDEDLDNFFHFFSSRFLDLCISEIFTISGISGFSSFSSFWLGHIFIFDLVMFLDG